MRLAPLRAALLSWYDDHARTLPWRQAPAAGGQVHADAYAVWVSEVMLQQTRVETVLRYYEPFLARFPDAQALAAASEDAVMAAWSGLGYYRRARYLHKGVREVVARYGGDVPKDVDARRSLPGVGRYTSGAIGSIAFGLQEPIVDGNVMRVFARLFAIDTPLGKPVTDTRMWALAEALVEGERPGDLNQALMELGATVCVKAAPCCEQCPVHMHCEARQEGRERELPIPRAKRPPKRLACVAVLARLGERFCLQRGAGSLFGGLWNLPMAEGEGVAAARVALDAAGVAADLGAKPAATPAASLAATVEHVLTHRRLTVQVYRVDLGPAPADKMRHALREDVRFVLPAELPELGVSALTKKAIAAVEQDAL